MFDFNLDNIKKYLKLVNFLKFNLFICKKKKKKKNFI